MTPPRILVAALVVLAVFGTAAIPAGAIETPAKQAFMIDVATGAVLLDKDADTPMPPASMSKLMTAYMVFERLKKGTLKMQDKLAVSERAWRMGGSKMFVVLNSEVSIGDLLRGVIIQSGNDACIVLAEGLAGSEEAFAQQMTRRARELGLAKSVFKNSTGWPEDGHVMTAREIALLSRRIIDEFPEYYKIYAEKDFSWNNIKQGNRNPLLYQNVGADGLKTGHTEASGYGLAASVVRDGRRVILVVNGLSSMKARWEETARLANWAFRDFENVTLFRKGDTVESADVWLGVERSVPLLADRDLVFTLPRGARDKMKVAVVYSGPIQAPIAKGAAVAQLRVEVPGNAASSIPLVAGAEVPKLGPIGRIGSAVRHLLWGSSG